MTNGLGIRRPFVCRWNEASSYEHQAFASVLDDFLGHLDPVHTIRRANLHFTRVQVLLKRPDSNLNCHLEHRFGGYCSHQVLVVYSSSHYPQYVILPPQRLILSCL